MKNLLRKCYHKTNHLFSFYYLSIGSKVECPICKWTGHDFLAHRYPNKPKEVKICPSCGAAERHRFAFRALQDKLGIPGNTLHIAPEPTIEPWLRKISKKYLSIDLYSPHVMENMDVTNLNIADNQYSLIWCFHVLEHIENDRKAMTELHRVLSPGGIAVIAVPVYGEKTYENEEVKTPAERLIHFKQEDHVRLYAPDIVDRLENAGFTVEIIRTSDYPENDIKRFGLEYPSTKEIFICRKPVNT